MIGILAQPGTADEQYIAASYVKFVEAAGAVAVPLSYAASNETTTALLDQLNGALLPGGGATLPDAARAIVASADPRAKENQTRSR